MTQQQGNGYAIPNHTGKNPVDLSSGFHTSRICELKTVYIKNGNAISSSSVTDSKLVAEYLRNNIYDVDTIDYSESFYCLFLSSSNKIIGHSLVSTGGINQLFIDIRILASQALLSGCVSVIVSHNHPSGNLKPSSQDIDLTQKIKKGLKLLDISLLDHIIITSDGYLSMADESIL